MSDKLKMMQEKLPKNKKGGRAETNARPFHSPMWERLDTSVRSQGAPWGIDVSHHQGTIDWRKVKNAGCRFAFMKATEGGTFVDRTFKRNREQAGELGIVTGAYHFFRTRTSLDAQMDNFASALGTVNPGELSPVLDIEVPSQWTHLPVAERNELVLDFIEGMRTRLGRNIKPIVYLSPSFADDILRNDARLKDHPLWLAHYTSAAQPRTPRPWSTWKFWQWTERGRCDGISTAVDLNRFNGTAADLDAMLVNEDLR